MKSRFLGVVAVCASALVAAPAWAIDTDEEITDITLGDVVAREVMPPGKVIQVITSKQTAKGIERRLYQFKLGIHDLFVRDDLSAYFTVRMTYPSEVARTQARFIRQAVAAQDHRAAGAFATAAWERQRNWRYVARGSTAIQPTEIFDNGRLTVVRFPQNMPIPAIYIVSDSGAESMVPHTAQGELVVLHTVARHLRLRLGREVLCVTNEGYDRTGVNPGTGTISPRAGAIEPPPF